MILGGSATPDAAGVNSGMDTNLLLVLTPCTYSLCLLLVLTPCTYSLYLLVFTAELDLIDSLTATKMAKKKYGYRYNLL